MATSNPKRAPRAIVLGVLALVVLAPTLASAQALTAQRHLISARYPDVRWVSTSALATRLARPRASRPVLLDARTAGELRVSQLEGARRIDPDHPDITGLHLAHDTEIVVYCSVGWRSGSVADALSRAGFSHVENLEGGIFAWVNEGRPVFRGDERVTVVHPYDAAWGRMLDPAHRAPSED